MAAQRTQRLRRLRAAVFQMLRFVGEDEVELHGAEKIGVARERAVGGEHEVMVREVGGREPGFAVVNEHPQPGRETGGLSSPILDERGGHDHEVGQFFCRARGE